MEGRVSAELRIGLIGCGRAAQRLHAPALARIAEARWVATADPVADRAELIARAVPECRTFASDEALLDAGGVDAVIVANPPREHLATAMRALRRGVSVLLEKPLCVDAAGLDEAIDVAAASSGFLMMGFNRRHWEPVLRLRRALADRRTDEGSGELCLVTDPELWGALDGPTDALENLLPHQLDLARFLFGREIESVSALWRGDAAIMGRLSLTGGTRVGFWAGDAESYDEWMNVQMNGRRFRVWSGSRRASPAAGPIRFGLDVGDALAHRLLRRRSPLSRSYEAQLRAFVTSVLGGRQPSPGLEDGIAVVRAMEAVRRSAAAGGAETSI
jgi:myo-inositol 2-dehydrogenase/D-chiro-inositol 1-dehydrogenase